MYTLAGFLTGLMVGLTGVGGGSLMTPILLLFFGVAPTTAVGTDLWFAALTKVVAGGIHHSAKLIDWLVVKRLWMGSLPASGLMIIAMKMGWISVNTQFLTMAVAVAVLITVLGIIFQRKLHELGRNLRTGHQKAFKDFQPILTICSGVLLGFLVTLTSVGAGALGTVLLTYLYPFRLTPARLIASDIVHAIPLALFAGLGHLLIGNVNFPLLGWLLLGSIPGVIIGAKLSARLPQQYLRWSLAAVLSLVAIKLILGAIRS